MATFELETTDAGFLAPRFAGTLTANGTPTITGNGTEFISALEGETLRFVGESTDYTISSVESNTSMTMTGNVPVHANAVAILSSEENARLDNNWRSLGTAAACAANAFQSANASTTLLGNSTTGTGTTIVLASNASLSTPNIGAATGTSIVLTSTGTQSRLQYDASHYATFTVSSAGDLTIAPSGGTATVSGILRVGSIPNTPTYNNFSSASNYPGLRMEVQRPSGTAAVELLGVYAHKTSAAGDAKWCEIGALGVLGDVDVASTPVCTYMYFGAETAVTYNNNTLRLYPDKSSIFYGAVTVGGNLTLNAHDIATDTTTGMKIGTAGGASGQKLGFFNATPIVQPVLATGASHTVDEVITVLQNLGLVRQL